MKKQITEKISKNIEEAENLENLENFVKKNEIEFSLNNISYKIRKPTYKEVLELREKKKIKFLSLIKDENSVPRDELIEQCKEKGYDIEAWRNERIKLQTEKDNLNLKLAEYGKTEKNEATENLKSKITELVEKQADLINKENEFLQYSIEGQLAEYVNSYLLYLILEQHTDTKKEKWKRVFSTYEELQNTDNTDLIIQSGYYLNLIMYESYGK
jgi:hypothetical protein